VLSFGLISVLFAAIYKILPAGRSPGSLRLINSLKAALVALPGLFGLRSNS
jgi:hypothetical protein